MGGVTTDERFKGGDPLSWRGEDGGTSTCRDRTMVDEVSACIEQIAQPTMAGASFKQVVVASRDSGSATSAEEILANLQPKITYLP